MVTDDPNKCQNRKSHNKPSNVSEFSLFSHFSVQRIFELITWNNHLALKTAITSRCDVTKVPLTSAKNRDIQGILVLLMQNFDKVVAKRFLVRVAGR